MDDMYSRDLTSTPISPKVEELNRERAMRDEYASRGMVGEPSRAQGVVSTIEARRSASKALRLQRVNKIAMAFFAVSVAAAIGGSVVAPNGVGFTFGYNTENVTVTQTGDYTTKVYDIDTLDGAHATLSFDELDERVPRVEEVQQMVSLDEEHAPVGVVRVENYPLARGVCYTTSIATALLGAAGEVSYIEESRKRK